MPCLAGLVARKHAGEALVSLHPLAAGSVVAGTAAAGLELAATGAAGARLRPFCASLRGDEPAAQRVHHRVDRVHLPAVAERRAQPTQPLRPPEGQRGRHSLDALVKGGGGLTARWLGLRRRRWQRPQQAPLVREPARVVVAEEAAEGLVAGPIVASHPNGPDGGVEGEGERGGLGVAGAQLDDHGRGREERVRARAWRDSLTQREAHG
eukprot:CAMPEP_0185423066 /NCGR_PEP_ID=MMETSP1365-20130426/12232_1 /TAXON_ID=38817 /ORGANISM="Gephyrocapsa oceanica, Strain RCC1303" /LENGTH=208 /DNA_ID=CAMNT_0028026903 /DNA_START=77 /DNA_END=700 /DNA_ORIENTATION=-